MRTDRLANDFIGSFMQPSESESEDIDSESEVNHVHKIKEEALRMESESEDIKTPLFQALLKKVN
eukprot:TRINITY_DN3136_c0_g1_i1.p1 TRINITY_DN3136_c0_g1~~TRINITY_DN3136_c0_g1_i1.p1  ORF type:complete len:65 (+),score=10.11 TRINITY_DN3136_c0_g1_i1:347-541(+)